MKQALLACLLGGTLAVTSGCRGLFHSILCCPLECIETACCEAGCGSDCGSSGCGHCGAAQPATCESCESSCHDGPGCGARPCRRCGPLAWLFGIFESDCYPDCGCGEVYRGECHSDLPDCNDPCDCHGNWVGRGCGGRAAKGCGCGSHCATADCAECGCAGGHGSSAEYAKAKPINTAPVYAHRIPQPPSAPRIISQTERVVGTRVISQPERVVGPRVISQPERVVGPTIAPETTWQAAQPRRASVQR